MVLLPVPAYLSMVPGLWLEPEVMPPRRLPTTGVSSTSAPSKIRSARAEIRFYNGDNLVWYRRDLRLHDHVP